MKQAIYYTYLGDNGTITTFVHIPGVHSIKKYMLAADEGKILTNGKSFTKSILIPEKELELWSEVDGQE